MQQSHPTLLEMPKPILLGYTLETIVAEKLESIIKLAGINTRMKDFYDLWTIIGNYEIDTNTLELAIKKVFSNRKTNVQYPIAFTSAFYNDRETQQRWNNFLSTMGKEQIEFKEVINKLSLYLSQLLPQKSSEERTSASVSDQLRQGSVIETAYFKEEGLSERY